MFLKVFAPIFVMPCGRTTFLNAFENMGDTTYRCQRCGVQFPTLSFDNLDYRIPVYQDARLYACVTETACDDFGRITGEIIENRLKKGMLGIRNMSNNVWDVKMPDGNFYHIERERGFPIWEDLEIRFGNVTAKMK